MGDNSKLYSFLSDFWFLPIHSTSISSINHEGKKKNKKRIRRRESGQTKTRRRIRGLIVK